MKQTRRKELKTNELSIYLKELYASAVRNANYIVGAVLIAAIVLVIGVFVQKSRHKAAAEAWDEYNAITVKDVTTEPQLCERAQALVDRFGDDPSLGSQSRMLLGELHVKLARSMNKPEQRDKQIENLIAAKNIFEETAKRYASRAAVRNQANIALAGVEESLYVLGKGDLEKVRQLYKQASEDSTNVYSGLATQQLATLAERTAKLQIIATQPAAEPTTAPATAPAAGASTSGQTRQIPIPSDLPTTPAR